MITPTPDLDLDALERVLAIPAPGLGTLIKVYGALPALLAEVRALREETTIAKRRLTRLTPDWREALPYETELELREAVLHERQRAEQAEAERKALRDELTDIKRLLGLTGVTEIGDIADEVRARLAALAPPEGVA